MARPKQQMTVDKAIRVRDYFLRTFERSAARNLGYGSDLVLGKAEREQYEALQAISLPRRYLSTDKRTAEQLQLQVDKLRAWLDANVDDAAWKRCLVAMRQAGFKAGSNHRQLRLTKNTHFEVQELAKAWGLSLDETVHAMAMKAGAQPLPRRRMSAALAQVLASPSKAGKQRSTAKR